MNPNLNAEVLNSAQLQKISDFVNADTPGNVGICLSGGGSRALTAGMGQLRALNYLKSKNGKTLLEQVKAISTVSGGSWVGTTFMYLNTNVLNDNYLNKYVPDQSKLKVRKSLFGKNDETVLKYLPDDNIGKRINKHFNPISLLFDLIRLHYTDKVETSMLWQTIIGDQILAYYNLFPIGDEHVPASTFSYNKATQKKIVDENSSLAKQPFALVTNTQDSTKVRPAFVICNAAMFVSVPDDPRYEYLAPVQSTPFYTGIFSSPNGFDANQKAVGGGGVTSFAFNSVVANCSATSVSVSQEREWALADIIGTSSAFYANVLENTIGKYIENPSSFVTDMNNAEKDGAFDSIDFPKAMHSNNKIGGFAKLRAKIKADLELAKSDAEKDFEKFLNDAEIDGGKFIDLLKGLTDLVPKYNYWPINGLSADSGIEPTRFADAGNLENMGIAALLTYSDIDKIISFINSSTPLSRSTIYLKDVNNQDIPNTNIVVDSQIPPLFGYQQYYDGVGYVPYTKEISHKGDKVFKYNQIFKSEEFANFLQNIVAATGENLITKSAVIPMKLEVLDNSWFGIANRGVKEFVFVYTNQVTTWENLLSEDVRKLVQQTKSFPHYSTFKTQLSAEEINLLANLTAWSVANPDNSGTFIGLFV